MSEKKNIEELGKEIEDFEDKYLRDKKRNNNKESRASFIAAELVAGVIVGTLIGYNLDQFLHTKILFLLIFVILGLISSLYNIYKKYK